MPQPDETPQPEHLTADGQRQLVLIKRGQRYVFRCAIGEESQLLSKLIEMARDPNTDLDWFDAAVLSHQMGQTLGKQMEQMLKS